MHPIVIHKRGSLSEGSWRKVAERQIGFLTERGISYLGTDPEKVEPPSLCGASAGVPFICVRSSRVIQIQREV